MINKNSTPYTPKKTSVNEENYFSSLSKKYNKASRILYILLALSFVFTLIFNSKLLTYTNFNYLFRDINSAAEVAEENYNSISYVNDELRVVKKYRGGIITASSTDVTVYTATGRRTLYKNESFVSPQISTSKKYAIVYELGGKNYKVYNSFAQVGGETLKYPISYVSVADSGWFAIVSRDANHTSVVYLYDDDMALRSTYYFAHSTVFLVDINENGNEIAIFKTETAIDKFSTNVTLCRFGKNASEWDVAVSDGIVCGAGFTKDGSIQLVCTDGYYLIDNSGSIKAENTFESTVNRVSVTSEGCAVSLQSNVGEIKNTIFVFDKDGKQLYNAEVKGSIIDMEYFDGYVFINHGNSISRIYKQNAVTSVKISDDGADIIVYDSNNILICCATKAKYIKI